MPNTHISKSNFLLTILGSLGAILIFALIVFIAYLPNRPDSVDAAISAERQAKADESRAAGIRKLSTFELLDSDSGIARIPIEDAMRHTVDSYNAKEILPVLNQMEVSTYMVSESEEQEDEGVDSNL